MKMPTSSCSPKKKRKVTGVANKFYKQNQKLRKKKSICKK